VSTHSPGPWRWDKRIGNWHGKDEVLWDANERPLVCETVGHQASPMQAADARLIAAAPELLAVLKDLWGVAGAVFPGAKMARLTALLARIEGKP
jgi:hypothetical protein